MSIVSLQHVQMIVPASQAGEAKRFYGELLGLTGPEIDQLEKTGVIGTKPTGSRII